MEMQLNTDNKARIAIVGAGEMGIQALHYASLSGKCEVVGFIDDTKACRDLVGGKPVIGKIKDTEHLYAMGRFDAVFVAIGYKHPAFKQQLIRQFALAMPLASIIAPSVYIDSTACVGINVMVYPGCIIDKNVVLGNGAVLNLGCVVSHDSTVGECCFLAPRVTVAGFSNIGERSFLGVGTIVIDNVDICRDVQTGAGATVVKDIACPGQYLGIPAVKFK